MNTLGNQNYYVYMTTNKHKNVLYTGVTNDLARRIDEHKDSINSKSFTSKYNCYFLVYYELHHTIIDAINREKQIKGWSRAKKNELISSFNPNWSFLNFE
jgi:putative endonuclease